MKVKSILLLLLLYSASAFSQADSISLEKLPLADFSEKVYKELGLSIYYEQSKTETIALTGIFTSENFIDELDAVLNPHGFTTISYNPSQIIIVEIQDANTSLKNWEKREALARKIQDQNNADAKKTIVIGDVKNMSSQEFVSMKGKVIGENNQEEIIGATIEPASGSSTTTDLEGNFMIELKVGENELTVNSLGFATKRIDLIVYSGGSLQISMFEDATRLDEIVVLDKASNENIKSKDIGLARLSMKEIQKLPSFMGELDVMKSLLTLPGVSSSGDGASGLNIRGGNTDQNLILLDDIIMFNPNHALGFFSAFNPDLVDDIKLYKGNTPSLYGGRISSVLSTTTKSGDKQRWGLKGGLGLTSSRLTIDGPVIKDKLTLTLGGRISTINPFLQAIQVPDIQSSRVNFYDIQGKATYWLSNSQSLGFQAYSSFDKFRLADELQFDYSSQNYSAFYNAIIGVNKNLNVRLVSGQYESNLNDLVPVNPSIFNSGVNYLSGKANLKVDSKSGIIYNIGSEVINYKINPGAIIPGDETSSVEQRSTGIENGIEAAVFVGTEMNLSAKLSMIAGLRISSFSALGEEQVRSYSSERYWNETSFIAAEEIAAGDIYKTYYGVEPRLGINYVISESLSLKTSYNRSNQYIYQISNTVAATPIDFWKSADNNLKPLAANTLSAGLYKNFKDNTWETSLEVYYRNIENTIDYIDFPDLFANDNIETQLISGIGRNYGVELSIKKNLGKLKSTIAYTYSRSQRKISLEDPLLTINNGEWYSSNFDKPHDLNILLNYNPRKRVSLNLSFSYNTGRPTSAPAGKFDDLNIFGIPIYGPRNNYRIPDYHRLDLSVNVFPGYRKDRIWKGNWTFSLFNVYGRRNAYAVYFRQESLNRLRAYKVSVLGTVLPSITYNIELK